MQEVPPKLEDSAQEMSIPTKRRAIISRIQLRNVAFALSASVLAYALFAAGALAVMSRIRGEGWDWAFLIPIAIFLVGILLPLVAGVRIIRGGGLAWLAVALSYLGLQVPAALLYPLYLVFARKLPISFLPVLLFLFQYLFVCMWFYTLWVTILAYRSWGRVD